MNSKKKSLETGKHNNCSHFHVSDIENVVMFPQPNNRSKEISALVCGKKCPEQHQTARIIIIIIL